MSFKKPLKKTPEASICTIPLPKFVYPHQKRIGKTTMKKVWVPRLAVIEKYVSRAGDRTRFCREARWGVSHRISGMSF